MIYIYTFYIKLNNNIKMDLCGSKGGQVAWDKWWGSCEQRNEILRSIK
jgi:hypothetical protein